MKKGDVVTIRDSSYSKVITECGSKYGHDKLHNVRNERGVIIELGCKFPDPHKFQEQYHTFNNTVVKTDSGKIVFIEERFLQLVEPTHEIMIDVSFGTYTSGSVIKISDKLYKEIKRESQTQ